MPLAALRELGRQRDEALQAAEQTWRDEQKTAKIHQEAKSKPTRLREALALADAESQAAETKLDEAEKTAVRAVANWREKSPHWKLSELAFGQLTEAVLSRSNFADVLGPVEHEATRLRDEFTDRIVEAQRGLDGVNSIQRQANEDLEALQAKQWNSPEPRRGQMEFRETLAQEGIPAVPFYAACDLKPGSDPVAAADGRPRSKKPDSWMR